MAAAAAIHSPAITGGAGGGNNGAANNNNSLTTTSVSSSPSSSPPPPPPTAVPVQAEPPANLRLPLPLPLSPAAVSTSSSSPVPPAPPLPPSSSSPHLIKPLVHFPQTPVVTTSVAPVAAEVASVSPNPPPPPSALPPGLEHLRLQQLYTLALADRMRFLQQGSAPTSEAGPPSPSPAAAPPPPPPPTATAPPHFPPAPPVFGSSAPPAPPHHPLFPYGKFDPRLVFRLPEEPKPQHSYIGLISMAILSSQEQKLVLADIYQYILDNFPYFRHRGPGWRNSIRHNLSLNDCFIKAGRAANGKGHFWAIHPACIDDFKKGDYRRRKAQRKVN